MVRILKSVSFVVLALLECVSRTFTIMSMARRPTSCHAVRPPSFVQRKTIGQFNIKIWGKRSYPRHVETFILLFQT